MKRKFKVVVNGKEYTVEVEELGGSGDRNVQLGISQIAPSPQPAPAISAEKPQLQANVEGAITAPMPGKILDVRVKQGDSVKKGDVVIILEAMKMENEIVAPKDGIVKDVMVNKGDNVDRGAVLLVLE